MALRAAHRRATLAAADAPVAPDNEP